MSMIGGRRRHLGGDRWITYNVFYSPASDGESVMYVTSLQDEVGLCPEAPEGNVRVVPGASVAETARAAVCHFIDTQPIGPGQPPADPYWALKHALRGGHF